MKIKLLLLNILILSVNVLFGQVGYNQEITIFDMTGNDSNSGRNQFFVKELSENKVIACSNQNSYLSLKIIDLDDGSISDEYKITKNTGDVHFPSLFELSSGKYLFSWSEETENYQRHGYIRFIQFKNNELDISETIIVKSSKSSLSYPVKILGDKIIFCWLETEIQAQIFDENMNKVGAQFQVNDYEIGDQRYQSIIALSDEKFMITWTCYDQANSYYGTFAQIYDNNSQKVGSKIQLWNTFGTFYNRKLTDKNILFYYAEYNGPIYAFILNNEGQIVKNAFLVPANSGKKIGTECIIMKDRFVITWQSKKQGGDRYEIFAQIFNNSGNKIGEEFQVNTNEKGVQWKIKIIALSDEKFIISWFNKSPSEKINAQIFDIDGNKIGKEFSIISKPGINQSEYNLSKMTNNQFIASWINTIRDSKYLDISMKYYLSYPIEHEIDEFEVSSPQMDETVTNTKPEFKWHRANKVRINFLWEIYYNLHISKNDDFSESIIYKDIQDTCYQLRETLDHGQIYYWKVLAKNWEGDSLWSSNVNGFFVSNDAEVDVKDEENTTTEFSLNQNYPNPFNPSTMINYQLPMTNEVQLVIYNMLGEKVTSLVNEKQQPGKYSISWDATRLSSGIYFYRLLVGDPSTGSGQGYVETRKMMFLK